MKAAFLLTDIQTHKANLHVSGSTAACCVLTPRNRETGRRQLHTANCGDARVVLARGGKTAMRLTHDHKATTIEEKKRIEADGGFVLRGRVLGILAVSRSFGDHALKPYVPALPYTKSIEISDEDTFIIIACDGVWDVMSDQEAVDFVANLLASTASDVPRFQKQAAHALVQEALRRRTTDNITAQIVLL